MIRVVPSCVLPPERNLVPLGIAHNGALRRHLRLEPGDCIEYFTASQAEEGVSKMASIMSCLSPRDININTFRFTRRTWVHDLASQVNTGDIILFSSKHNASYITKFFTQSGASLPVAPHLAPYPHLAPCRVSLVQGGTTLRWSLSLLRPRFSCSSGGVASSFARSRSGSWSTTTTTAG